MEYAIILVLAIAMIYFAFAGSLFWSILLYTVSGFVWYSKFIQKPLVYRPMATPLMAQQEGVPIGIHDMAEFGKNPLSGEITLAMFEVSPTGEVRRTI